ncbi:hypothetical protein SISSUDRAFT_1130470 [Sistotremastrum suecicum HHB10207 ss-3]|uniref:F-box domain-containing protein n=1 Tax=Sistotremastrum suecicum HHB10207 ss-3 TaxID=1314776 RepID=A0A166BDM5_9AGAM|nr:hypothetical protein SISSUDRAFT_1130470 [Sistotremastrum suecicum HHB10207 ss-3]
MKREPRSKKPKTQRGRRVGKDTASSRDDSQRLGSGMVVPAEIIGMIVDEVDFQAASQVEANRLLCRLAHSSRVLQKEAERRLYSEINFPIGELMAQKTAPILRSRTAKYVRYLTIWNYGPVLRRGRASDRIVSALPFHLMTGLKSIEVYLDGEGGEFDSQSPDPQLFTLLDQGLQENILTEFICDLPLRSSELSFLHKQRGIRFLQANLVPSDSPDGNPDEPFRPFIFPKLCKLNVNGMDEYTASSFMTESKVVELSVMNGFTTPRNWASMAANLQLLDIAFSPVTRRSLKEIVRCSPHLQIFVFKLHEEWSMHLDATLIDILEELKNLNALAMALGITALETDVQSFATLAREFSRCRALHTVLLSYDFQLGQTAMTLDRVINAEQKADWFPQRIEVHLGQWIAEQLMRIYNQKDPVKPS